MPARRTAARIAGRFAIGLAPLAVAAYAAAPAAAHGSMTDPVSRVAACYAEGPEAPKSAACKAAVAASGAQAFYDWNAVNIANAAGQSKALIPDGQLCSAGNDKYKGLDLARADWPASPMASGAHTFRYKGTAPHKGSFELYVTKDGYDPTKPLKWSDLEPAPFVKVSDPGMQSGDYVFSGTVPNKTGRHLIYSVWQRSDSPEAFYSCSDVVFGKDNGGSGSGTGTGTGGTDGKPSAQPSTKPGTKPGTTPSKQPSAPADKPGTGVPGTDEDCPLAKAPTDQQIADGVTKSTVEHNGHGDNDPKTNGQSAPSPIPSQSGTGGTDLAETGASGATPAIAIGGAGVLAIGAAVLFGLARRRATPGRHGR
ncbi:MULTISPECIES: lytic polysaccharide monooxygenase [unclassified Streptomyces]|uniref:lytic polysaccharide monooxygenase n=1 Tax=unclassified Streptomyces TaxID=2593676 RepID=UPI000DC781E6|nr:MULTISPECIES: lytic polysaccharide monooxygenase [unclassified Streptomyces]AWZ09108.1 chitin-binding protein [Streptomyces sp. ICC4]AWZ16869.1 chitin-binding protein [Streptomyces sp. ICC1]